MNVSRPYVCFDEAAGLTRKFGLGTTTAQDEMAVTLACAANEAYHWPRQKQSSGWLSLLSGVVVSLCSCPRVGLSSVVPRPSLAPVFDCLQYAKAKGQGLVNLATQSVAHICYVCLAHCLVLSRVGSLKPVIMR